MFVVAIAKLSWKKGVDGGSRRSQWSRGVLVGVYVGVIWARDVVRHNSSRGR